MPVVTADHFADLVVELFGRSATLDGAQLVTGGSSRQTWILAVRAQSCHEVVVQLVGTRSDDLLTPTQQAQVMARASDAGVPVPRVLHAADDGVDGPGVLVMERVHGEVAPGRVLHRPELAEARERFAADCGAIAGRLAAAPAHDLGHLPRRGSIADARHRLDALGETRPAFELALAWLEEHEPPARTDALVHGDFRVGNLMVAPGGLVALLDWELAHLGDPIEDLGYLCVRAWRFGGASAVGGIGDPSELLAAFGDAAGLVVTQRELDWWTVVGTLRWGVVCLAQSRKFIDGTETNIELAAIGRRVAEVEYDLMRLLDAEA